MNRLATASAAVIVGFAFLGSDLSGAAAVRRATTETALGVDKICLGVASYLLWWWV